MLNKIQAIAAEACLKIEPKEFMAGGENTSQDYYWMQDEKGLYPWARVSLYDIVAILEGRFAHMISVNLSGGVYTFSGTNSNGIMTSTVSPVCLCDPKSVAQAKLNMLMHMIENGSISRDRL